MRRFSLIPIVLSSFFGIALAQSISTLSGGVPIVDGDDWNERRPELLQLVMKRFYGTMPPKPAPEDVEIMHLSDRLVCEGKARETLSVMLIHRGGRTVPIRFGIVRPVAGPPSPVIVKNDRWIFDLSAMPPGKKKNQYQDQKRVEEFRRVRDLAISRGYAICKFNREDVAMDAAKSHKTGVLSLYPDFEWGALAAWGWAYQPLLDHLLSTGLFDAGQVIATGHSRGGKAALAATIFEPRIAIAAPSASGSGGTGSWKKFTPGGSKQTARHLVAAHGHWFGRQFAQASTEPGFDGDLLISLIAPRGLVNTQGADDTLANPWGTRKMFEKSAPIFSLLGAKGRAVTHWRSGGHGHLLADWLAVIDYADALFAGQPVPKRFNNWPERSEPQSELRRLDRADAVHTYREINGQALKLYAFHPADHEVAKPVAAVIFFHGGGWKKGTPASMAPHCRYFASRGIMSFTADYRFAAEGGALQVQDCAEDAKAATTWLTNHAADLGIDPDKIIVSGGSAGGHLAMLAALTSRPSSAKACLLFNPAAVLTAHEDLPEGFNREMRERAASWFNRDPISICPLSKIHPNQPPMLLMHGSKDWLLPAARKFSRTYQEFGNQCEILVWEGLDHGFYHLSKNRNRNFIETCEASDRFLVKLGILSGEPSVEEFIDRY